MCVCVCVDDLARAWVKASCVSSGHADLAEAFDLSPFYVRQTRDGRWSGQGRRKHRDAGTCTDVSEALFTP